MGVKTRNKKKASSALIVRRRKQEEMMSRSSKKGPYVEPSLMKKVQAMKATDKKKPIKT